MCQRFLGRRRWGLGCPDHPHTTANPNDAVALTGEAWVNAELTAPTQQAFKIGVPTGIRTPVLTVKGWCPRPLDDGDAGRKKSNANNKLVEPGGIEPPTSCMPCKRSPS